MVHHHPHFTGEETEKAKYVAQDRTDVSDGGGAGTQEASSQVCALRCYQYHQVISR